MPLVLLGYMLMVAFTWGMAEDRCAQENPTSQQEVNVCITRAAFGWPIYWTYRAGKGLSEL